MQRRIKNLEAAYAALANEHSNTLQLFAEKVGENANLKKRLPPVSLGDKLYKVYDGDIFEVEVVSVSNVKWCGRWTCEIARTDGGKTPWEWSFDGILNNIGVSFFRTWEGAYAKLKEEE